MMHAAKWFLAFAVVGYFGQVIAAEPTTTTAPTANEFDIAKGSVVSLHFHRAPAYDAFKELYRQAGAPLKPDKDDHLWERVAKKPVTIDVKNVSFWEAIDALEEQTDITVDDFPISSGLIESRGGRDSGPIWRYGAFKIIADDSFGRGRYTRLKVFAEPRLQLLSHAAEATITEALDVLGTPVAPQPMRGAGRGFDMEDHHDGGVAFDVDVPIDSESRRIGHLKGNVRVVLIESTQRVEIGGLGKKSNVEQKAFGRRFAVSTLRPTPNEYAVSVAAFNSTPPGPGLMKVKSTLLDANGNAYQNTGMSGGGDGTRRADFTWQFINNAACGPAETLVLEFPGKTREINVPFEFGKPLKKP